MNHAFSPMGLQGRVYREEFPMCSCGIERLRKSERLEVFLRHRKMHEITRTEIMDHDTSDNLHERLIKLWPEFSASFRVLKTHLICPECEYIELVKS